MSDATKDGAAAAPERTRMVVDLWSRTIDAQIELARMAARSRQIGIALVGVSLVIAALLVSSGARTTLAIGGSEVVVHASALVLGAAALIVVLLRIFDLEVHERMQRGAASVSEALEKLEPAVLDGLAKKLAFTSDERAQRSVMHTALVPAVAAVAVLLATNAFDRRPLAPETLAAPALPAPPETELVTTTVAAPAVAPAPAPVVMRAEAPAPAPATKPAARGAAGKPGSAKPVEGKAAAAAPAPVSPAPAAAEPKPAEPAPAKVDPPRPAEPAPVKAEEPKPAEAAAAAPPAQ